MTADKVAGLLDPSDPQNVPRAIALLLGVIAIRETPDSRTISYNPSEFKEHRALSLLGLVLERFLMPFIDMTMDLSDQFRSLTCYAHLAFYLYRLYRTSFMTAPLYNDTNQVVKNIAFHIAKQQLLDPTKPLYILHVGTDRLEVAFADVRTQDHASNFDILSLTRKLATGAVLNALMLKRPEWDRGHRRLKYFNTESHDHVNPASVTGNVIVGDVSLQHEWIAGHSDAVQILCSFGFTDAPQLFSSSDFNLFCPIDSGKVVGVSLSTDTSAVDISELEDRSVDPLLPLPAPVVEVVGADEDLDDSNEQFEIELEDLLATEARGHSWTSSISPRHKAADHLDVTHPNGERIAYNKASIVRCALTPKNAQKSLERVLRVAGVPKASTRTRDSDTVKGEVTSPHFGTRDLGVTLVRCGNAVALGVMEVKAITEGGRRVPEVEVSNLGKPGNSITLAGQLLHLIPASAIFDTVQGHADDTHEQTSGWLWSSRYLRVRTPKDTPVLPPPTPEPTSATGDNQATLGKTAPAMHINQYLLTVQGWLFLPVAPNVVNLNPERGARLVKLGPSGFCSAQLETDRPPASTWRFCETELAQLTQSLWDNAQAYSEVTSDIINAIPVASESIALPYKAGNGT